MPITRRRFLHTTAAVAAGFAGLRRLTTLQLRAAGSDSLRAEGYGPLQPDPKGILDLPEGFTYRIISRCGETMDDELLVPDKADGMATFPGPRGLTVLIRNHEVRPDQRGPFGEKNELLEKINPAKLYDGGEGETPNCGGTTTVVYDTKRQKVVRQFLSLAGTIRNCAGGPTPWNSWITCEETVVRAGRDKKHDYVCEKDHGYNFEVPASPEPGLADPVPLKAMGRFNHEAIAVDPETGIVYQTEDRDDGLIYRFLPETPGKLAGGGTLQALQCVHHPSLDTRNWDKDTGRIEVGQSLTVQWVDVDEVESPEDALRHRGFESGAARFARGEGMWYSRNGIYLACTSGGRNKKGQIWRYVPSPAEGKSAENRSPGRLELFVEPNEGDLVTNADNLTVAPWGDLIVCEDRSGDEIRLIGVTPEGRLYPFANNHLETELAGVVFSPDGSTLFVNLQHKGLTVAITGPWQKSPPA